YGAITHHLIYNMHERSTSIYTIYFFFIAMPPPYIYTLSLHDALPISHNDKSVHGVLNPTYQAGLRRDAVQPDIEAERKKRDEIEAGKSYCSRRFGGATCDDKSAQIYAFCFNIWLNGVASDRKSGSARM